MPRRYPTTKLNLIGHLGLRPEKCVGDYLISKRETSKNVKPPKGDLTNDSIEMLFVNNCHEYQSMLRAQRKMLSNMQRQGTVNVQRIKQISKMQDKLRKRFISVNDFMKECSDKRRKAQEAVDQELALHQQLTKDINNLKVANQKLGVFRNDLQNTVAKFKPYKRIIKEVVNKSDIYESTNDCIDRCHALMLAQVEIAKLVSKNADEIEGMRQSMIQITNDAAFAVLGIKNDLSRLERSYNISHANCLHWEKVLANAKNYTTEDISTKAQAHDGLFPLYSMLCLRRNIDRIFEQDDIPQIANFIANEVNIMKEVLEEMEKGKEENKTKTSDLHIYTNNYC